VPSATLQMLLAALKHSRLDYGNGVQTRRLQSVLNAAAFYLRTRDHITDARISLHWLRVPERIQYKLAVLAYQVLHGDASCTTIRYDTRCYFNVRSKADMSQLNLPHVTSVRSPVSTTCLVDENFLPVPTASWYHPSNCQQSAAEPLRLRLHTSGIHCQLTSLRQARCSPSIDC